MVFPVSKYPGGFGGLAPQYWLWFGGLVPQAGRTGASRFET